MSGDYHPTFRLLVGGCRRRCGAFSALIPDGEPPRPSLRSMVILYAVEAEVNDVAEEEGPYDEVAFL